MIRAVIIQGSSRSQGHTYQLISYLEHKFDFDRIDLKNYKISAYDYEFNNQDDDFKSLITKIIHNYELLIFATPIYWYTMSGYMKNFFDRISDLLILDKPLARKFKNKYMAVISCGSDQEVKNGFYMPFIESAKYLDMHYEISTHGWIEDNKISEEVKLNLEAFANHLILKLNLS